MSEETPPEISQEGQAEARSQAELAEMDALLEQADPDFKQDLNQVAEVKPEGELDDEGSLGEIPDQQLENDVEEAQSLGRFARITRYFSFRLQRLKIRFTRFLFEALLFLKTRPKEWVGYVLSLLKVGIKFIQQLLGRFSALSKSQKGLVVFVLLMSVGVVLLTLKNLKGVWLPQLNPPIVKSLAEVADEVFPYSMKDQEMFYRSFPRSPDLFLFEKFKVNLSRSPGHPNPMGAFEVVLELDSKGAAIEVQDRQVEFHDLIQREFESQSYPSLLSDLGKQHLKNLIKKNLDERLSQGWVEDVHFQTFILKP